jgi:myosin heavy subunit
MAEEVNINISITTNAAPVANKINKELGEVRKQAQAVRDDLDEAFDKPVKQGTKDLETLKKTVSPIKGLINDLTGGMSDAFFQAYESVKATTAGVKGLDVALKTAAFGIAILVIQSVIQLYDELVQTEEEEAESLAKATEAKKKYIDETRAAADALDKERKARSEGANELKREIAELEASGAASETIYEKRKELLEKERLDLLARQAYLFDDAEAQKEIGQQILDKESELRALGLANEKQANDKSKEDSKKAAQDRFDALNRENVRREEALKAHEDNVARIQKEARDRRISDAKFIADYEQAEDMQAFNDDLERLQKQKEAGEKRNAIAAQLANIRISLIEDETERELAALKYKYDEELKAAQGNKELLLEIEKKYAKDVNDVTTTAQNNQVAKDKAYRQQIIDLAVESALSIISSLKELNGIYDADNEEAAKRAFNRQKALSIAETIVSTYATAQKAYSSQIIPLDPTSIVRGQIAAAVAIVGGLARVAAISATKFNSSGANPSTPSVSSAAAGGGPSVPAPQFNIVGQSGTNQLAAGIGAQFDQPIRAYVVGGDVTTAQQLERQRIRTATFG